MAHSVVVVGGGLAGMAAAVALQSAGNHVTLVEARKTLGGRAGSFEDPNTGEILDNCQHVLLGCCTNLIDFYRRIGVEHLIHWDKSIRFADPRGKIYSLRGTPKVPAPFHLALSGLRFAGLSFGDRLKMARGMLAMLALGRGIRKDFADVPFGQWLAEHQQDAVLIDAFYELVLISALNEKCRESSAEYAIQVFQESLLFNSRAYYMGTPACPLGKLYERIPLADLRLGSRMTGLLFSGSRVTGVQLADEKIEADTVVLAVNHHALEKWIPEDLFKTDGRFSHLGELQSVPILGAHLWFDRPILTAPHVAMMGGPLQWLFRKSDSGWAVHGVISAAREWVTVSKEECLSKFTRQIRETFPAAREAKLQRGVIVIEKRATFSPLPGVDRLRPTQAPPPGGIEGLFLAGDYTQTGWPATMEGAVRSGYLAAAAITGQNFLVPDLPRQWPARWLGKKRPRSTPPANNAGRAAT